jgi:hypothetical protein
MATAEEVQELRSNSESLEQSLREIKDRLFDVDAKIEQLEDQIADTAQIGRGNPDPAFQDTIEKRIASLQERLQDALRQEESIKVEERSINQEAQQARFRLLRAEGELANAEAAAAEDAPVADETPIEEDSTEEDPTNEYEPDSPEELGTDEIDASAEPGSETSDETDGDGDTGTEGGAEAPTAERKPVPKNGTPPRPQPAQAQWAEAKDLRVKLRVPNEYLVGPAAGPANILQKNGGILFPYTPTISMENQAQYSSQSPLHSNYPLYFYKNSSVGPITVSAKFTVQNEFEGAVLLGVIHMLRALTKMKFGDDPDAGSPPPVCRFDAYGDYMMYNVPVSIASWRHELPDNVDYISVGRKGSPTTYGHSMVPSMSTISLTLNVMYSRREMLSHNVKDWLSGGLRYRGYL